MEHEPDRNPLPVPSAPAIPTAPDRARWTPAKQRTLLHELLETGSVAQAARAAGMSRSSAHRLRVRPADTLFDRTWGEVPRLHAEQLADPFWTGATSPHLPHAGEHDHSAHEARR